MHYDCLIIDDDHEISQTVCEYFNMFDIATAYVTCYEDANAFLSINQVSLLLLDVNLGKDSGFLFCKELRKSSNTPVIFISARDSEADILSGLSLGGDDYIIKPFSMGILLAKVKAMLKRSTPDSPPMKTLAFGDLRIEYLSEKVYKNGEPVKLKPMEWKLLVYLLDKPNHVITKEELLANVWGDSFVSEGTLSVHIRHLREKLEEDPNVPTFIKTVWGTGYMYEVQR